MSLLLHKPVYGDTGIISMAQAGQMIKSYKITERVEITQLGD